MMTDRPPRSSLAAKAAVLAVALAPGLARAACEKDTDCKGDRICQGGECVAPGAPAPAGGETPVPEGVFVTLDSNLPDASLAQVRSIGVATAWGPGGSATAHSVGFEPVCTVPCRKPLDRNYRYVVQHVPAVGGSTSSFILPDQPEVTLKVRGGSDSAYVWGFLGVVFGGTTALIGVCLLAPGLAIDHPELTTAGAITTGVGVPMTAAGLWAMEKNGTEVHTDDGRRLVHDTGPRRPGALGSAAFGVPFGLAF